MDIPSITTAKAAATPQPTATLASNAADKAAESTSVAKVAQDRKQADAPADTKTDTPERDSRSLKYMVQGNRVITTIVDDQSKKVVVQIPDAELIRIAKSIDRMQGFFIEQNA